MKLLPPDFDRARFLREYWQKKPLLIRAAGDFVDPLSPEELAGLACEEFMESRLVFNLPGSQWQQKHGPFTEEEFLSLPEKNYTLLVQAVDHWVEGVRVMLRDFDFIPAWRIEDIMVSYSTDGGNVGPHFDYYDVFLIQGAGSKHWKIGGRCDSNTPLLPNSGMRLLRDFDTTQEWTLNPGDILYLPPNLAHHGVAMGNCLTYSLGFRTPSLEEILSGVADECAEGLTEDQRYVDEQPALPARAGEIENRIIGQLQQSLQRLLDDPEPIRQWFGKAMTRTRYDEDMSGNDEISEEAFIGIVNTGAGLLRNPVSRFAFQETEGRLFLYVDGYEHLCQQACMTLVQSLCDRRSQIATTGLPPGGASLLYTLYAQGAILLA